MKSNFQFFICIFVLAFSLNSCSKVDFIELDKDIFDTNINKYNVLDTLNKIEKINHKIVLKGNKRTVVFEDNFDENHPSEYNYIGKFKNANFHLVSCSGNEQTIYCVVNIITSKVDVLLGFPVVYNGKLYAIEDGYTDSKRIIQCFNFTKDSIKLLQEFSFVLFDKRINNKKYYFKNNYLYFEDNYEVNPRYFKVKISSLRNYKFER